jgi:hypothetical protein
MQKGFVKLASSLHAFSAMKGQGFIASSTPSVENNSLSPQNDDIAICTYLVHCLPCPIVRSNFVKRHGLADSGTDLVFQQAIVFDRFAVLYFHRFLTNARCNRAGQTLYWIPF